MKHSLVAVTVMLFLYQTVICQTTFHGNVARTGVYDSAGPKQLHGVKWSFKTDAPIIASPAIANGVVYIGSVDASFYAIDQKTGKQKWKIDTVGRITSSAAVVDGTVYFAGYRGGFYALSAETGAVKWKFNTEYDRMFEAKGLHGHEPKQQNIPDAWDLFTSSPAVVNGRVYFGSGDGNIYALNAETGLLQWKFSTKDVVHGSPAVVNNTVYIGSWDSILYALDAETGAEKWRFQAGEDPVDHNQVGFQSSPAVVDGTVYIGCRDSHVYAIDAATGRKKWDYSTNKGWVSNTPAVRDGLVYVGTNKFYVLDAKTGRLRFSFDSKVGLFSSPALAGDLAYIGAFNGRLYAIDTKSGKLEWEFQTDSSKKDVLKVLKPNGDWNPEAFSPTFSDFQDMYVAFYKRFSVGAIISSPVVDQGEIYFGSADGFVYALN